MRVDFSAVSPEKAIGRALRAPLRLVPRRTVVRVLQGPLRGARWVVGASTHGAWLGSYDQQTQDWLVERVKPGDVVYDIGANVGFSLCSRRGWWGTGTFTPSNRFREIWTA